LAVAHERMRQPEIRFAHAAINSRAGSKPPTARVYGRCLGVARPLAKGAWTWRTQ
jgi:hypothetical protein